MVGKAFMETQQGQILNLQAVLKLSNLWNSSSTITTLVTGTIQSLSSINDLSYFEPISIMILPRLNYEYSLVIRALNEFNLRYTGDCDSSKNCGPFGGAVGDLPTAISFEQIQCLEKEKRMRVLVDFPSRSHAQFYRPFNLSTTLIREGLWDDKINQLCVVACPFLNMTDSLSSAQVGDCMTRLRLGFPAVWSIRDISNVIGTSWGIVTPLSVGDESYNGHSSPTRSSNSRISGSDVQLTESSQATCYLLSSTLKPCSHQVMNLGSIGWLEANEMHVRIIALVAFLLEVRLLQLSWSSRWFGANQVGLWFAEKSTLFLSFVTICG
ncbi:hypothetical protein Patl1_04665 [Pistacia atlantica]|uniref:Uncharacterized protein n=1 Tax=Pistacia atlantica TaxID=434234 RepID=A0ACC1BU31_9ROSI|nr:hypothetical protein Patl1_04665 [Pistacia atlantica]